MGVAVELLQGMADGGPLGDDAHRPLPQGEQGRIYHIGDGGRVVHMAALHADARRVETQVEAADIPQEAAGLPCLVPQGIQVSTAEDALLGDVEPDDHHRPVGGEHHIGGLGIVVDIGLRIGGHVAAMAVDAKGAPHHHHFPDQAGDLGAASSASARLVSGPMVTRVISPGWAFTVSTMYCQAGRDPG